MNYYVTTSIPYVNGSPHLGHALEFVMADVLARAARQKGAEVIFSTGTDEHGTKNEQKALSLKLSPQEFVDKMSQEFRSLQELLNISSNRFIRTTDPNHERLAQLIWKNMEKDIYKASYSGWYDVKQEEFVPDAHADPARMKPDHPQAYQKLEEENYFFRLSSYTDRVLKAIQSDELKIEPKTKRNEILALLESGLDDISISRPKDKVTWGVPVPGDDTQVMYVWFEALMNYITLLGYPDQPDFKNFWPADVQIVGKDIIRFHAAIWPAMLMSLNLPLLKMLFVHGFITVEGQTMSKSLGNGIHPKEIVDKYGADAYRYFFLRHISSYGDGDFSWKSFDNAYNNELANELGNAVSRTVAMVERYQKGDVGELPDDTFDENEVAKLIEACHFDVALEKIWDRVRALNQYIDDHKPWQLAKSSELAELQKVLASQVVQLKTIGRLLEPFLPETATKIHDIFAADQVKPMSTVLFPKSDTRADTHADA
jgi:methionyl-tRNA synthetase